MQIQSTKDYNMFKTVSGNRELSQSNLVNLSKSILSNNMLAVSPILVNTNMEIIDGQHRLEVARNNDLTIYYIVMDNASLTEVLQLNVNRAGWTSTDYLKSHVSQGNENYIYLQDFLERFGLTISNSLEVLTGTSGWGGIWNAFKLGTLTIPQDARNEAEEFVQAFSALKPYVDSKVYRDRDFVRAMRKAFETVNVKTLVGKLQSSGKQIEMAVSMKDYLRQLEDILNWRQHKEFVRLYN